MAIHLTDRFDLPYPDGNEGFAPNAHIEELAKAAEGALADWLPEGWSTVASLGAGVSSSGASQLVWRRSPDALELWGQVSASSVVVAGTVLFTLPTAAVQGLSTTLTVPLAMWDSSYVPQRAHAQIRQNGQFVAYPDTNRSNPSFALTTFRLPIR